MKIDVTRVYEEIVKAREQVIVNRGGARSSKSHSLAQHIIERLNNHPGRVIGVTRKTLPALRATAYNMIIELLRDYGRYVTDWHNKSDHTYSLNGGLIRFFSVDDPEKVRSMEFNDVWMEEATEFSYTDFQTLKLRLSAPEGGGYRNQMFLSFNPDDEHCWIAEKLIGTEDVKEIVSTYRDNPYLSKDYIRMLERTKHEDPNIWRIYGLGEWGKLENVIYHNWDTVEEMPEGETWYGLDFGFNNPSAMLKVVEYDGEYYLQEKLYETGLTNSDLVSKLETLEISKSDEIYADCAEPARIEDILRAGFNIHLSDKSVKDGLDFCKRVKIHIHSGSVNLLKEIKGYSYKTDKNGQVFDEPVKFSDHLCDCMRYALYTHLKDRSSIGNWSMVV